MDALVNYSSEDDNDEDAGYEIRVNTPYKMKGQNENYRMPIVSAFFFFFCVYILAEACVCLHVYKYACVSVCMYVCLYAGKCICICMSYVYNKQVYICTAIRMAGLFSI